MWTQLKNIPFEYVVMWVETDSLVASEVPETSHAAISDATLAEVLQFWPNVDQFWHQISKSWYIPKAYFSPEIFPRTYSNYVQNAKTC